ncbi:MAG: hypothetical protein ABJM06_05720 [Gilvibacter sp.]
MEAKQEVHFMDKIVAALRQTAVELEEFQVQAALGKAEAKDVYKGVKKKFDLFIHDSEFKIQGIKEKLEDLNTRFEEFRVQAALGKADAKDAFFKRKKEILALLHEIEVKIKTNKTLNKIYAIALIDIEQIKIQLEILEQKFKKDKKQDQSTFDKANQEFNEFVSKIKDKFGKKKETRMEHFQNEISEAFDHFKKAFTKP